LEQETLKRLEYDKICQLLQQHTSFSLSRDEALKLQPTGDGHMARQWLQQTDEAYRFLHQYGDLPYGGIVDITPSVRRAGRGGTLAAEELFAVGQTLLGARKIKRTVLKATEKAAAFPWLRQVAEELAEFPKIEHAIAAAIDEQGHIRDEASPELARLRRQIRQVENRMRERLEAMIRDPDIVRMLQEPIITVRYDHWVLPVKAHYRQALGGIVYDQSASGSTLFIEPAAVAEDNQRLQALRSEERQEVERILRQLSSLVGQEAAALEAMVEQLAALDVVMAKARLARAMGATLPLVNDNGIIRLKKARHPLIDPAVVVPIDVELGKDYRTLIITGPNTGGKTVTLKTIGLLSAMGASGLFVPAAEGTELAVFSRIFADIGDEQSIEQSLSTFSSHMRNIVRMLEAADERTLLLFDELGAGTDPQEGAALAIAILEEVHRRGCRVVATTHYSELKAYAYHRDGVMNASVEFDVESLRPTYRLLVGVPGRSHAFTIAERLGLPRHVLAMAREQLDDDARQLETMVRVLEEQHHDLTAQLAEVAALRQALQAKEAELARREAELQRQQARLKTKMEQEVAAVVAEARKKAEGLLAELKQMAKEQAVKPHQLTDWQKRMEQISSRAETEEPWGAETARTGVPSADVPLAPGCEVLVLPFGQRGVVEALQGDQATVRMGSMKLNVAKKQLQVLAPAEKKRPASTASIVRVVSDHRAVSPELDLRGKRVDEALADLDKYLDEAVMAGLRQVRLIHGKGTGSLRQAIQDYLRRHSQVGAYRLGHYNEGGSGVTVVELK